VPRQHAVDRLRVAVAGQCQKSLRVVRVRPHRYAPAAIATKVNFGIGSTGPDGNAACPLVGQTELLLMMVRRPCYKPRRSSVYLSGTNPSPGNIGTADAARRQPLVAARGTQTRESIAVAHVC
jgi:hypothetical protein